MKNTDFLHFSFLSRRLIPAVLTAALLAASLPVSVFAEAAPVTEAPAENTADAEPAAADAESPTEAPAPVMSDIAPVGIRFAKDYREVYNSLLKAPKNEYLIYDDIIDYAVEETASVDSAPAALEESSVPSTGAASPESGSSDDYSKLNTREANVDEADVVRTDGKYIYTLNSDGILYIAEAAGKDSSLVSSEYIYPRFFSDSLPGFDTVSLRPKEMYLDDGSLFAIFSIEEQYYYYDYYYYEDAEAESKEGQDNKSSEPYEGRLDSTGCCILTFDVSDPAAPVLSGACWQNGSYKTSRKIGSTIYLYTKMLPELNGSMDESVIIPCVNGNALPATDICIPNSVSEASYLIVSSMNTDSPSEIQDSKVFLSGAEEFYVSEKNLYILISDYTGDSIRTEIARFGLDQETISPGAASFVIGKVNDSFSIDEYNGYLRVLTTYTGSGLGPLAQLIAFLLGIDLNDPWTRHNAVYVLNVQDLTPVSRLGGLAEDEDIKSARFFGDIAYFVTFENTDPLFTVDLSDPAKPVILGQLDITGFSSYLHPYGDGLLLGMGYGADEYGTIEGLKLSMFDISDPSNVRETDRLIIPGITYCEAMENYKTILADPGKNLIGFYCQDRYLVFSYTEGKGFERLLHYDLFEDGFHSRSSRFTARGLYSGNELYVAGNDFLTCFNMEEGFCKDASLDYLRK